MEHERISSVVESVSDEYLDYSSLRFQHNILLHNRYTFCATHYMELRQLESLYPNVKNFHLLVEPGPRPRFMYTVREGCAGDEKFGIALAEISGFPPKVIEYAKELRLQFDDREKANTSNADHQTTRTYYQLAMKLLSLRTSPLMKDPEALRRYLVNLKSQFVLEEEGEGDEPVRGKSSTPQQDFSIDEDGGTQKPLWLEVEKEKEKGNND